MTLEEKRKYKREYARKWRSDPKNRRHELDLKKEREFSKRKEINRFNRENLTVEQKEKRNARARAYKKKNKHIVNEIQMRRYAKKKRGSLTLSKYLNEIRQFYKRSQELTYYEGVKHNVDHIIPLVHENVCGLHVPWNLQILTAEENVKKHNTFDGTYENESWRVR